MKRKVNTTQFWK